MQALKFNTLLNQRPILESFILNSDADVIINYCNTSQSNLNQCLTNGSLFVKRIIRDYPKYKDVMIEEEDAFDLFKFLTFTNKAKEAFEELMKLKKKPFDSYTRAEIKKFFDNSIYMEHNDIVDYIFAYVSAVLYEYKVRTNLDTKNKIKIILQWMFSFIDKELLLVPKDDPAESLYVLNSILASSDDIRDWIFNKYNFTRDDINFPLLFNEFESYDTVDEISNALIYVLKYFKYTKKEVSELIKSLHSDGGPIDDVIKILKKYYKRMK